MDSSPHKPTKSIDGFVPRPRQYRQVGFGLGARQEERLRGIRTRQPGFRAAAPMRTLSEFTPQPSATRLPGDNTQPMLSEPQTPHQKHHGNERRQAREKSQRFGWLRHLRWKRIIKRTALVAAVFLLLSGGWLGWKLLRDSSKVFGGSSNLLGFLTASKLRGEDTGRVNILLAGNSADDPGHNGANLTDSIMLVSVDVRDNTAFMLSIPRDVYVDIPGNGYAKINAAYPEGQSEGFSQKGYPKGGMGLLEQVVAQNFHIPIDYYGLIDYAALRQGVNAVGGITINIQSDDPRGLYDPSIDWTTHGPLAKLTNGWHTLNGEQALDLARARGDAYGSYGFAASDFDRAKDQRQMLIALKDKTFTTGVLANPFKLGQVFDAVGNNVHTDLSTGNVRRLYDIFKQIKSANIVSYGLNSVTFGEQANVDLLKGYLTSDGEDALIPAAGLNDFSQVQLFLQQITSNNPVVKEAANVVLLNGGNTTGLAGAEAKVLTTKGMNVSATGDAPKPQNDTVLVDNSGGKDPATLSELKTLFSSSAVRADATLKTAYPDAAFIVVLGQNQPMP